MAFHLTRSELMGTIRSHGNKATELKLIAIMQDAGITGWRRGQKLHGKPDFVFRKERVAVFVDGCFWHGCPKCYREPKTNKAFWKAKIERNQNRDAEVTRLLRRNGWKVVRIWEHQLKHPARIVYRLRLVLPGTK